MILKIRAWDEQNKAMVYDLGMERKDNALLSYLLQQDEVTGEIHVVREGDGIALPTMVFIGHHDICGDPLYVGDIVTLWTNEEYDQRPVVKVTAEVCYDESDAGFYYHTNNPNFPYLKPWFAEKVNRVGNIYESPELSKFPTFEKAPKKRGKKP